MKITPYDTIDYLKTEDQIASYLEVAFEDGDINQIKRALGNVARARSMSKMAKDTQLSRESLYKSLSETGNPEFSTICKVLEALGLRLSVVPITP
jgi:probable addiction module antidote protein